jgi:transcriptional regulator with XRE-family HTH domain
MIVRISFITCIMIVLDKIKEIRNEKRISQSDIAEYLGIAHNNYGRIERGEGELTVVRLFKIAEFLKVSPNELLGFDIPKMVEPIVSINETEKDKEIAELRKRISELEKMNNLFEGNAYVIESISRKLINAFIEISYESAMYFHSEDTLFSEEAKHDNYTRAEEKYQNESKKALKDLVSQGSFIIVLKKMLFEQKDKLKIILEWILTDKLIKENLSLSYDDTKKLVRVKIDSHSTDDIVNEAMDMLFIPFFSGMGAEKQKSNGESDKM